MYLLGQLVTHVYSVCRQQRQSRTSRLCCSWAKLNIGKVRMLTFEIFICYIQIFICYRCLWDNEQPGTKHNRLLPADLNVMVGKMFSSKCCLVNLTSTNSHIYQCKAVFDDNELLAHLKKDFIQDEVWSLNIDLLIMCRQYMLIDYLLNSYANF